MDTSTVTDQAVVLQVTPLGDRIVIEPPDLSRKNNSDRMVGDLIMPEGVNIGKWAEVVGLHHLTTALAVGPDCKHVKQGDRIVVTDRGLFYVNTDGVRICGCTEAAVVGIVK